MEAKVSRRKFLQILGSASAVGAAGCADSAHQNIYPNVKGDQEQIPGVAAWFSSTCTECSAGCGIKVRVRDGRAVKIEGNVEHPVNRGGMCAIGQSSLQDLYDPDRIRQPIARDRTSAGYIRDLQETNEVFKPVSWEDGLGKVTKKLGAPGIFFTGYVNGTLDKLIKEFCAKNNFEHVVYDLASKTDFAKASELTYGTYGIPKLDFSQAEVIVNFGADFLETWISPCEYARGWSDSRKKEHPVKVFHIEPRLSLTGANADKWISVKPGTEILIAQAILGAVAKDPKNKALGVAVDQASQASGVSIEKINLLIESLKAAGTSLVLTGGSASTGSNSLELNIIVNLINIELGNLGKTVNTAVFSTPTSDFTKVKAAIEKMRSGAIDLVFFYDVNPDYLLPADLNFKTALNAVAVKEKGLVVSFNRKLDESSKLADVILPTSHSLESWGDFVDGQVKGLVQPSMETVFDTRSLGEILVTLNAIEGTYFDYLKANWKSSYKGKDFEADWKKYVELGGSFGVTPASGKFKVNPSVYSSVFKVAEFKEPNDLVLYPFPSIKSFDGRTANRPWMQELPDPMSQISWDSWAEIHPDTAKKYDITQGDYVQIENYSGQLNVFAFVTELVNPGVIAVPIGQGHACFGRYAEKVGGGNVLTLLSSGSSASQSLLNANVKISKGRGKADVAMVQGEVEGSNEQHGRELSRTKFIEKDHGHEKHDEHHGEHHEPVQVYEQRKHPLYQWGMAIDLATCTGCSACVTACYAENNIPTVGKRVMQQGREMAWLRIERYYEGKGEELQVSFLPMMCQHCQNAPCEPVCPVYATYHNEDGINAMVYNRCVGTRYCGNNCSYKVRRFNWFEFEWPSPLDWQLNPDVTKRTAGVMEKCNFCVQRITAGKDHAKDEARMVRDGEIQPACVQGCPTKALVFGNLLDPESEVSKVAKDKRAYKVLDHHLNTQPSVSYLENVKYRI